MPKYHYFNNKLSAGFVSLFSGRMIQFAANGLVGLFLPVYLLIHFQLNIVYVMLWYLAGHISYALFLPIGAQWLNKFGLRRALRASVFFDALFYVCIILMPRNVLAFALLALVIITLDRTLFWLPYHVDFAKFTERHDRGKEVGIIWATKSLLGIVLPVVSGLLITYLGFNSVFIIVIILFLLPIIPFMALPRTHERFEWKYIQTFRNFFKKENRPLVLSNMANGAENSVALIIWPIFIWRLLNGNYVEVGILSSLIVFIGVVIQLLAGKFTDLFNKRRLLRWGSIFYAFGWLMKMFVLSGLQIFLVGTYHQFAQIFKDTPFDTLNYEYLADRGHYVDEYTVLKELAVQSGKASILALAIVVAIYFGVNWTFLLAAMATLFVNAL